MHTDRDCELAGAKSFGGLLTARIFLGVFESTILPSFVLITQMWWTRREQSYRTVAYQVSLSVAGIFGKHHRLSTFFVY